MKRSLSPDPSLASYRELLRRLARDGIPQRVANGHPEHAAILLETMFESAHHDVCIYTGRLAKETYDRPPVVEAAVHFLRRRGCRLRILVQRQLEQEELARGFLGSVRELLGRERHCGELDVRFATGAYASSKAKHFAVMDDRGFRFEIDHDGTKAIANFNEPDVALELLGAFDQAFARGDVAMTLPRASAQGVHA